MKNQIDAEVEFPKVEKMLYDLAWKFVAQYPQLPFEEAKSQAYWGYVRACHYFRPDRGMKFSSFVYQSAWFNLKNLVMEKSAQRLTPLSDLPTFQEEGAEHTTEALLDHLLLQTRGAVATEPTAVADLVSGLPEDCKEIVRLLTEVPKELLGLEMTPKQFFKKVKQHLVERKGWATHRVEEASRTLKRHLNEEVWA